MAGPVEGQPAALDQHPAADDVIHVSSPEGSVETEVSEVDLDAISTQSLRLVRSLLMLTPRVMGSRLSTPCTVEVTSHSEIFSRKPNAE
jgi:hypothetical protein